MTREARICAAVLAPLLLSACNGVQSSLAPQGPEAARVATLLWVMTAGSAVILIGVLLAAGIAMFGPVEWRRRLGEERVIVGAGVYLPAVVLSALLIYGFVLLGRPAAPSGAEPVKIAVVGERWWWRVQYRDASGRLVDGANEIRIPVDRPVEIELTSADVIHSFWAPKLGGKLDMIPGRKNVLTLQAGEPGVSRGQCAEYCGGAHALMAFYIVVLPQPEYEQWLARQESSAEAPATEQTREGMRLFAASGCGACHAIRGTRAAGVIGPDLTHVGGRMSLAAAASTNDEAAIARWIRDNQSIKPGNRMPPYRIFTDRELSALSAYLSGLK